ncbi:MAG: signal transduction histidine kinase [Marivirga sp.]|jgi:signal transduction histidine kinase
MKNLLTLFLISLLSYQGSAQDIDSLKRQLISADFTANDSVNALILLGRELTYVDASLALEHTNKALNLAIKTNNLIGIAYAYRNLAGIYSFDGSLFISMDYLQTAIDIFEAKNDSVGLGNCYISLGHTNRRLQNREEEVEYHLRAFNIFRVRDNIERTGVSAHNLGESYFNSGEYEKSTSLTLLAIEINDSINKKPVLSACYKVMGLIALKNNDFEVAERHFLKVLEISEELGENSQKVATAESLLQLATIYKQMGDADRQSKFLLSAVKFTTKYSLPKHLQRAYLELVLFSSESNYQEAVQQYIKSYSITSDSLDQKQLRDRRNLTKSVVQVHELSQAKINLEEANLLQSQKIQGRNIILSIIILSAIVLFWLLLKYARLNNKLKSQNATIASQKSKLEELNNTKDKFFSIVAHDLKTPLFSLKSFSVLLTNHFDKLNKDEILTMSKKIGDSVDNTITMANNLITWATVQMNEYQYNEETINLSELTSSTCELFSQVALEKEIELVNAIDNARAIIGDKNQVEFIIRNLVNNAVKFTNKGGVVELKAETTPDGLVKISIADTGVGIHADRKAKLFAVGRKQSTVGTAGEKGTGLGLMLSYEFMKINGGNIEVDSVYGKGTTFYLTFRAGD